MLMLVSFYGGYKGRVWGYMDTCHKLQSPMFETRWQALRWGRKAVIL